MLIGAPLVSGFASMPQCADNDNALQTVISIFTPGMDPSTTTCSVAASSTFCQGVGNVVCATSCQYHGPCMGDGALAVLTGEEEDPPKCEDLPGIEFLVDGYFSGTLTAEQLPAEINEEELAGMQMMLPLAKELCGLRRARKMTDARPVDASKVHKLAAAMLRSTKTMAHRLA